MYPHLNFEADGRPPGGSFLAPQYCFPGSITLVSASGVGLCLRQPQLCGERRFERPRRGTDDQGRAARMRTVEQVGDFAGRVGAKRVELAPCKLSSLAERLNDRGLPDGEVVANLESEIRKPCEGILRSESRVQSTLS